MRAPIPRCHCCPVPQWVWWQWVFRTPARWYHLCAGWWYARWPSTRSYACGCALPGLQGFLSQFHNHSGIAIWPDPFRHLQCPHTEPVWQRLGAPNVDRWYPGALHVLCSDNRSSSCARCAGMLQVLLSHHHTHIRTTKRFLPRGRYVQSPWQ